jgi:hypothetical protein
MAFAATQSNLLRVDNKASFVCPLAEDEHGKNRKADFWRCNCSRELRNTSIGGTLIGVDMLQEAAKEAPSTPRHRLLITIRERGPMTAGCESARNAV